MSLSLSKLCGLQFHKEVKKRMDVTLGGLSQLLVILCVMLGSLYLTAEGRMTSEQLFTLWGGILSGMGIGYINGKKAV